MDIVLVRHGRTRMNAKGCYCGITDVDISPEGEKEIRSLAENLRDILFDGIYASPLKRTTQTADILADSYRIDGRLKEMNFGVFEGMTYQEIAEKYPLENSYWQKDFINYRLPEGESLYDVYLRTLDFIEEVSRKHRRVLAITHGGIIRCALAMVFHNPNYFYKFKVGYATANIIAIEDGYMFIKGINCSNFCER